MDSGSEQSQVEREITEGSLVMKIDDLRKRLDVLENHLDNNFDTMSTEAKQAMLKLLEEFESGSNALGIES